MKKTRTFSLTQERVEKIERAAYLSTINAQKVVKNTSILNHLVDNFDPEKLAIELNKVDSKE